MLTIPDFSLIDEAFASAFRIDPMASFLRDRGTRLPGSARPSRYSKLERRQCFSNAWKTVLVCKLDYWEGWAWREATGFIPFHHAWCVDPMSRSVVDRTWDDPQHALSCGVHVPRQVLGAIIEETGTFGVFDQGRGLARDIVRRYFGWSLESAERSALR